MVELQSCGSLVNASALCDIEEEVKGESTTVNVIAEISAELQRERQRNSELMLRISLLESQLQERDEFSHLSNRQGSSSPNARGRRFKMFKKQKIESDTGKMEDVKTTSQTLCLPPHKDVDLENRLVNWMSMDDYQISDFKKLKHADPLAEGEDTDNNEDGNDKHFDGNIDNVQAINELKVLLEGDEDKETNGEPILSIQRKPGKIPFCPKELNRIIELEELLMKNAQSHTIRKIIVFASLGTRHGCEDMYELDFNHFRILQKGDAYESSQNPGEHVVYENPGVRRKVFYPNRQNTTLCPVRILEEEATMRPSDASCPSCLFLCIKYGGSTRNIPQQEYVRQRMGRKKLKSFGPVICRMAMLAHIRTGSFFFKALGITLLFMAGFPDDLVRMETKYKNLDLLQKYYRTDEDAQWEELFLSHPSTSEILASPNSRRLSGKSIMTKSKGKKHISSQKLSNNIPNSAPSTSLPHTQFGLMGYTSIQTQAMTAIHSMLTQTPTNPQPVSNPNFSYPNQSSYPIFPSHFANSFLPVMYWAPPPISCSSSYKYQSFPSTGNYISTHPHPFYTHASSNPLEPKMEKVIGKNIGAASEKTDSDSNSSSSSTEPKER